MDILRSFALVYMADTSREAVALKDRGEDDKAVKLLQAALDKYRDLLDTKDVTRYEGILAQLKNEMSLADRKYHRESSRMISNCLKMPPDRYNRK
jgi:hypothetical protein